MGKVKTLGFTLSLALMCTALLASTAAAQNSDTSTTGTMGAGSASATTVSSSDRKFAMTAAMGGMAEVEMARLALTKASSDAVKQYAQKMIDDHTPNNAELMQIASTKGITLPTAPDAKHRAMMARMEKLFRDESMKGRDADLKAFAAKTLPVVQQHLQMARDLHGQAGGMDHKGMNH